MMMNVKRKLLHAVALLAMFSAFEANAQSTQSMDVTATVNDTCVITNVVGLAAFDFGVIDTTSPADTTYNGTFEWACNTGTTVEIELDAGDNPGSLPATARQLLHTDGINFLEYRLCQDSLCAIPWGDGVTAADVPAVGTGIGNPQQLTIYGVLDGTVAQSAISGAYQETVVLSLNF